MGFIGDSSSLSSRIDSFLPGKETNFQVYWYLLLILLAVKDSLPDSKSIDHLIENPFGIVTVKEK